MRIKEGFRLRNIMGQATVIGEGAEQVDFNKLVTLNPTAAYLWSQVEDKDFNIETLADLLIERYSIDREIALRDATSLYNQWCEVGLLV